MRNLKFLNKFNAPAKDPKSFSFYCYKCKKLIAELITKDELGVDKECKQCLQSYKLSTSYDNYFVNLDLTHQLTSLFADEEILNSVVKTSRKYRESCQNNSSTNISDIFDSEMYKKNEYIHSKNKDDVVLTVNVNIDGAKMFEVSKKSLWSVLLQINELPENLRFKIILIASSWYADHEPDPFEMQIFVKTFLKSIHNLMHNGLTATYKGKKIKIFIYPLLFPVDAKARSPIALRIGVIGYHGCVWCYIFGKQGKQGTAVRYPVNRTLGEPSLSEERTHNSYLKDVKKAKRNQTMYHGVHGLKMALIKGIPNSDAVWIFPAEYLHLVALGVSKKKVD